MSQCQILFFQVVSFLQQVVTHKGFYDEDLEWVGLDHIQLVTTMAPATTMGRHRLSKRFTANVRLGCVSLPSISDLNTVYAAMVQSAFGVAGRVADAMVDVYSGLKDTFAGGRSFIKDQTGSRKGVH